MGAVTIFGLLTRAILAQGALTGTVKDGDTKLPVPRAVVRVNGFRVGAVAPTDQAAIDVSATADDHGEFSVQLPAGEFELVARASADHYLSPQDSTLSRSGQAIHISRKDTPGPIEVLIFRTANLSGTIVDEETRAPISKVAVRLWETYWTRGQRRMAITRGVSALTDERGNFSLKAVAPNEYFLDLAPSGPPEESKSSYGRILWPGTPSDASGFVLSSGTNLDVGVIRLHRERLFRIRGTITGECKEGARFVIETGPAGPLWRQGVIRTTGSCGKTFEVANLTSGRYEIAASSEGLTEQPILYASAEVRVHAEDEDVTLRARGPAVVRGRLIFPKEVEPPQVSQPAFTLPGSAREDWRFAASSNPSFQLLLAPFHEYFIQWNTFPGWAVTNAVLDGAAVGGMLKLGAEPGDHIMEITFAPRSARLYGHIQGYPVREEMVILLIPWPLRGVSDYPDHEMVKPDPDGGFSVDVTPGTYRALTVWRSALPNLEQARVISSFARNASEIEVKAGEFRSVTLTAGQQ